MSLRRKLTLIVVAASLAAPARAWWNDGHERIAEGAIGHLPPPLEAFFRTHLTYLKATAGIEPPGDHFIDIDNYPEFDVNDPDAMSRDLATLIALHGESFVNQQGLAPWTTENYIHSLSAQMAAATTAADWTALLLDAAELAHYVGDLHNPLHLTANYNGQLTGNTGVHARYEGEMIWRNLTALTIEPNPAACVYLPSPIDMIFDGIYAHYPHVAPIMAADTAHRGSPHVYGEAYYAGMWTDTGAFTHVLFQCATEALASAWYTAWVNAGSPAPIYGPGDSDYDQDGDVDLADAAGLQRCRSAAAALACPRVDADADGAFAQADWSAFSAAVTGPLGASLAQVRARPNGTQVTLGRAVLSSGYDLVPNNNFRDLYVQDDTGAIRVYAHRFVIEAILHQAAPGTELRLSGTLGEFNGMRQLVAPLNLRSWAPASLPAPQLVAAADFQSGSPTAEGLESRLVTLRCASFPAGGTFCSNCTYPVSTPGGTVVVWVPSTSGLAGQSRPAGAVDLVGIFGQVDTTAPFDAGYQLWIRSAADVVAPGTCP